MGIYIYRQKYGGKKNENSCNGWKYESRIQQ